MGNLKLSKTAIRELTRLYKGVLVAAFVAAAFVSTEAKASGTIISTSGDLSVSVGTWEIRTAGEMATMDAAIAGKVDTTDFNTYQTAVQGALDAKANASDLANYVAKDLSNLTAAQQNAINSGITADLVSTYNGYATTIAGKADASSVYTKGEVDTALGGKQASLNTDQLAAVNSGITADLVSTYNGYATGKQDALTTGQLAAVNSGITADKVTAYDGYATGKQDKLTDAQLAAANSGITSDLVTQIGTNQTDIATINGKIGSTDISSIGDGSITGAISTNASGIATNAAEIAKLTTGTDTGALNVKEVNVGATGLSSAGDIKTTGSGNIISAGNISTTNGTISGKTGSFSGDLGVTGTTTTGTLSVTNNATVGGTLAVTGATTLSGALNGTTATFTGAVSTGALSSNGLDAGAGDIKTTGKLEAGAATVSSLDAGSGLIKTTGETQTGTLAVSGTSAFTGVATMNGGIAMGGKTVTAIETGAVAAGGGKTDTLATTSSVLASAANGTYNNTVKGKDASTTIGDALDKTIASLNNVLTAAGTEVDSAKVDVLWNSTDSTLATVLGSGNYTSNNKIVDGDSMTTALSTLDAAIGTVDFSSAKNTSATDLTTAATDLDTAIGDRSALNASGNGNLTNNTDLATALKSLDTTLGNIKALDGTTGTQTGNLAGSGSSVADHLNAIDTRLGQIDGLRTKLEGGSGTTATSAGSNLKAGSTLEDHLTALDASIGNRTAVGSANTNINTATATSVAAGLKTVGDTIGTMTLTGTNAAGSTDLTTAVNALDTAIGNRTIASANTAINTGVATDVATGFTAVGNVIGDQNYSSTKYVVAGDDLTTAIGKLDQNIDRVDAHVNAVEDRMGKMHHEMKSGFAGLAALAALKPNARAAGDTQVGVGAGYYRGTTGLAVGAVHYLNDNVLLNVGASYGGNGTAVFNGGVMFGF